jgi:hypothetical protein
MPKSNIQRVSTIQSKITGKITPTNMFNDMPDKNKIYIPPTKVFTSDFKVISEIPELKNIIIDIHSFRLSLLSNMLENIYMDLDINTNVTKYDF